MSRHHPWSLTYLRLWLITKALRLLILFQRLFHPLPAFTNPNVVRTEQSIPSRDHERRIRVRWYRPASSNDLTLPILINFHGSGFCVPALGQDEAWCATVAEKLSWVVVDADYRKAPENPFPLPLEDAEDVALHVLAQSQSQNPHTKLALSGFSSGGCLALGLASLLGPQRVRAAAVFYPTTDIAKDITRPSTDPLLPPALMRHFFACYVVPGSVSHTDPRLAPTYAEPGSFPERVWVAMGEEDPLCESAKGFVGRLKQERQGREVSFVGVPGVGHGFDKINPGVEVSEEGRRVYADAVEFLTRSVE